MVKRVPSVPLIACDPYFSVWASGDTLYSAETYNWCGAVKPVTGIAVVDGEKYRFMGTQDAKRDAKRTMNQVGFDITPTKSVYSFEGGGIGLKVSFITPLLLTDLMLLSRPCSYISFEAWSIDNGGHDINIIVDFSAKHCYDGDSEPELRGGVHKLEGFDAAWLGKTHQAPLNHSGDGITIDWGYLYIAGEGVSYCPDRKVLLSDIALRVEGDAVETALLTVAYDDVASIMYFGDARKGYWTKDGDNIIDAIGKAVSGFRSISQKCEMFDESLTQRAIEIGGEEYALVCAAAYRQSIAAHKLITDNDGNAVFLSKENFSNGCIGTVDVSYPSVPLYLLFEPELVLGMMRPVFKFAAMPVWEYDFAPHDVGRYPYATGQVYGADLGHFDGSATPPPLYLYPKGSNVFNLKYQMPVEECGNMLAMAAAYAFVTKDASVFEEHMPVLEKWAGYLIEYGPNPGYQLCTDDFAGHLSNNVNLAVKAVMGIYSFSMLLDMLGRGEEGSWYGQKAREIAAGIEARSDNNGYARLTFDGEDTWSLKYNAIWDKVFGAGLFTEKFFENETDKYIAEQNKYGVPLDSRKDYTKSDWVAWASALTADKDKTAALLAPVCGFLLESESRVPFSDWYDTKTGKQIGFQNRSVQGGMFMPMLVKKFYTK